METCKQGEEDSLSDIPIIKIPIIQRPKKMIKKNKKPDDEIFKPVCMSNNAEKTNHHHQDFVESPIFSFDTEAILMEDNKENLLKDVCIKLVDIGGRIHTNPALQFIDNTSVNHLAEGRNVNKKAIPYSTCEKCGLRFVSRSAFTSHLKLHSTDRLFACTQCGRRYTTRFALQKHEKTHLLDKPFKCELCGKGFLHQYAVKKHKISCELLMHDGTTANKGIMNENRFISLKMIGLAWMPSIVQSANLIPISICFSTV